MAEVDIVFTPGWEDHLTVIKNRLVMSTMSDVKADAQRLVPVDTGDLKESLTLILYAPGVARIVSHMPYCAAVELGFHGEEWVRPYMREGRPVRGHTRQGNTPAQPFLRPSLYRPRTLAMVSL